MSANFGARLTTMFDDAAATITPRGDFGAVRSALTGEVTLAPATPALAPSTGGPFRRGAFAAAAAVVLFAGGAAAYQAIDGPDDTLSTAPDLASEPNVSTPVAAEAQDPVTGPDLVATTTVDGDEPPAPVVAVPAPDAVVERTASVASSDLDRDPPMIRLRGAAPDGEPVRVSSLAGAVSTIAVDGKWTAELELIGQAPDGPLLVVVTFGSSGDMITLAVERPTKNHADEEGPKPGDELDAPEVDTAKADEPEADKSEADDAKTFGFSAKLGDQLLDHVPPKVFLRGTAQPGTHVSASSESSEQIVSVGEHGYWEMWLRLPGFDPGETAHIRVLNSVDPAVHELVVTNSGTKQRDAVSFTAGRVEGVVEGDPIWQRYAGTGQPGSTVVARSDFGVADVTVDESGQWTLKLWLEDVPAGSDVTVEVSNSATEVVKEFRIEKPSSDPTIAFTANALYAECDSDPPYNEYWGTAEAGTTVKIVSPYGSAERTVGPHGAWDARVEFPDAPIGETFVVKVKSLATGQVKEFPIKRVEPA